MQDQSLPVQQNQASQSNLIDIHKESEKGLEDLLIEDIGDLEKKIQTSKLPMALNDKVYKLLKRMVRMAKFGNYSSDYEQVSKYISWITSIPWGKYNEDNLDVERAKQILDQNHVF